MPVTPLLHTSEPPNIPPPPTSLDELPFWGVWKREMGTKVPYNPKTGQKARPNDPGTFSTRAQAEHALATGRYAGLCILVDESLGITGGDLDHIVPDEHAFDESKIPPAVWRLIRIANTWTCWSPSGTGIRFIFSASLGRRYMTKNKANRICIAEAYSRLRFMTVKLDRRITGTPDTFNADADDLEAWHEALGFPLRDIEQPPRPQPTYSGGSHSNEKIIETASRVSGEKFRRLHAGDITGYPESQTDKGFSSEADGGLAMYLCGYTGNDDQVADIMRSGGLYRKKYDRSDYLGRTITSARRKQSWWFDWDRPKGTPAGNAPPPAADEILEPGATCDQKLAIALETIRIKNEELAAARETIVARERVIERERERRVAAEHRADRIGFERSQLMQIIRNPDLNPGQKLTHFVTVMDLGARIANGEEPARHGYRLPATTIAAKSGQKVATVRTHLKAAAKAGWFTKTNVREPTAREGIDPETGEITSGTQDVTYIAVPDNDITLLIAPVASYRKDEPETRGGARKPTCKDHPDAATITTSVTTCADCHAELDRKVTVHEPEPWGTVFAPQTSSVVNTSLLATKTAPQPPGDSGRSSAPKFAAQPPAMPPPVPEEPADFWTAPPPESEPAWLWEGAVS